jgi:SAM-dependent methyltransferase
MSRRYLMEDPREADRLAAKVDADLWAQVYVANLIGPYDSVLDVGCGPGTIASAVAHACPEADIVAMDLNSARITAHGEPSTSRNVRFVSGDAIALPFRDESFDVAYCRLVLQYLPDRQGCVREIARVTRGGGTVLLYDLDGQLLWHDPQEPAFMTTVTTVLAGLGRTGFDPHAGRRLFRLAQGAGLTDLQVKVEPYHLIAGSVAVGERKQWKRKLEIATPAIAWALGSQAGAAKAVADFLAFLDRSDTLTYSMAFTVVGHRAR